MAKHWHKKHISTKWGIAILGFLVVSLILTVGVLNKNQNFFSQAAVSYNKVWFGASKYDMSVGKSLSIPVYMQVTAPRSRASLTTWLPGNINDYVVFGFSLDSSFKYASSGAYPIIKKANFDGRYYISFEFDTKNGSSMVSKMKKIGSLNVTAKSRATSQPLLVTLSGFPGTSSYDWQQREARITIVGQPTPTNRPSPTKKPTPTLTPCRKQGGVCVRTSTDCRRYEGGTVKSLKGCTGNASVCCVTR